MPTLSFVAGDPSGDAHTAHLIGALAARLDSLTCVGLGGPAMRQAGVELLEDLTTTAAIGPFDAAKHLGRLRRAARLLEQRWRASPPDLVVLVDFGDFNLPVIAPIAKRLGLRVAYYISPQLWAWGRWRLRYVRQYVDRMLVFFPFEEALYRREQIPVTWVGHPLVDTTRPSVNREEAFTRFGLNPWRRVVGLLPGSREQELARHLPLMLAAARRLAARMPGLQFLIPQAPTVSRQQLEQFLRGVGLDVYLAEGPAADALQTMDAAAVASGTATLETALCEVPMAVVYRTSWPTYLAARLVVRIPDIALVNVVAGERIVPELVQHHATPGRLSDTLLELLRNEPLRASMVERLRTLKSRLGPPGAVDRAASAVLELLNS